MKRYERDATHTFHSDLLVELDCVLVRWILQVTVIYVQPLVESEHEISLVLVFKCTFSWAGEELTSLIYFSVVRPCLILHFHIEFIVGFLSFLL